MSATPIEPGRSGNDPEETWERTIVCAACGDAVAVVELPYPFIDPDDYRCGACLLGGWKIPERFRPRVIQGGKA